MNAEKSRPSSSSDGEEYRRKVGRDDSSTSSSNQGRKEVDYSSISGEELLSSESDSGSDNEINKKTADQLRNSGYHIEDKESLSSLSSKESAKNVENIQKKYEATNGKESYSESESSNKDVSSLASESDHGLLQSILSDSSSEKIVTDIDISSPKDGKFSSSTDEELLRKFREQQANRRFRPRSAKIRRDAEPEPENVQHIQSTTNDRRDRGSSSSLESSDREKGTRRKRQKIKYRKHSSGSSEKGSSRSKRRESSRSSSLSSEISRHKSNRKTSSTTSSLTSESLSENKPEPPTTVPVRKVLTKTSTESETSKTLTTSVTSPSSDSETTITERPPSRQGRRPKSSHHRHQRKKQKSKTQISVQEVLTAKSSPLPKSEPTKKPLIEPGFPWPYNEDCKGGDRALRKHIEYHKRRLNNLLAQEYLQKHLELELRKAGAQFKEYEREPRPLSPKQVKKFREKNITWVYLGGRLFYLPQKMGGFQTRQRGRPANKVIPSKGPQRTKSKSQERGSKSGKRSVSFEKGSGRSSSRSDKKSFNDIIKSLSGKSKKSNKRRGSGSGSSSRKSSLSSRGSARTLSRSSSRTSHTDGGLSRSRSSSRDSRAQSRSSSKGSKNSSHSSNIRSFIKKDKNFRSKERPETAKTKPPRKTKSASSVSSTGRSSSRESSKSKKDKHHKKYDRVDEEPALQRVLFTDDVERKMSRKKKQKSIKIAIAPGLYSTKHPTVFTDTTPTLGRRGDKQHVQRNTRTQERQVDDYNFYKDHNVPGHAFPYYYLSYLLAMDNGKQNNSKYVNRVVLKPAPVNTAPAWSPKPTRRKSAVSKPKRHGKSPNGSPRQSRTKKKTKSVIENEKNENMARSSSRESASTSLNRSSSSHSYSRIQPGSGPVRCSWNPNKVETTPTYPVTDHRLKNTDNPAIQSWLRRKDAQLRARKQNDVRKHRRKTAKLIDEQNDLEDKHERALRQYETWKKTKDREILLRRRNEATEANSVVFAKKVKEIKKSTRKERPHTAPPIEQKMMTSSTFSELRSSNPNVKPHKPRPKSANIAEVSFSNPVVVPNSRPRSATPSRKPEDGGTKSQSVFGKTENFFKSFLGIDGESKKKETPEPPQNNIPFVKNEQPASEDRDAYDKWVRSSSPKVENRKSTKRNGSHKNKQRLPKHNHTDNELISNLAKRRIESILASRKQVDTGLKKRPNSGKNGLRNPKPPAGNRTDSTNPIRKWKLREDDIIKPQAKPRSNNSLGDHSSSSAGSNSAEDRPKFSFSRRKKSKSTTHHRNPVVREAINQN